MRINKIDHQKLAQVLLITPLSANHQGHSTIKEAILEMNASENSLEVEFVNDLFSLKPNLLVDKWYEGSEDMIGFFYEEE